MSSITCQQYATDTESLSRALMHTIRGVLHDFIVSRCRQDYFERLGHAFTNRFFRQTCALTVGASPQRRVVDLCDDRPMHGIDYECRSGIVEALERVVNVGRHKTLRPSDAIKAEPQQFTHCAARTVRTDHPISAELSLSIRCACLQCYSLRILGQPVHARAPVHARIR